MLGGGVLCFVPYLLCCSCLFNKVTQLPPNTSLVFYLGGAQVKGNTFPILNIWFLLKHTITNLSVDMMIVLLFNDIVLILIQCTYSFLHLKGIHEPSGHCYLPCLNNC